MKIPNSELVGRIIREKLKETGVVRSQQELGSIVQKELEKVDSSFHITPERARRIAIEVPDVKVTIETRKSESDKPEKCPACNGDLKTLYAKNLDEEKIQVGFMCEGCGYHGDVEEFMPMRYIFMITRD